MESEMMNSNGQILTEVNKILDSIRSRKDRINQLKSGLSAISDNTQDCSTLNLGRDLKIELSGWNGQSYLCEIRKQYKTAVVFIKRGINEEIEMHEKSILALEKKLSDINLVQLSR